MRTLIIVYSFTGNNLALARHLAEKMDGHVETVKESRRRSGVSIVLDLLFKRRGSVDALTVQPSDFEHVIFVAPVWDRHIATPMRAAMRDCSANLPPYSVALLCGLERDGQTAALLEDAKEAAGKPPLQLLELWVADVLAGEEKQQALATTNHRVSPEELAHFAPKIDGFIEAIEQASGRNA